jgi:predicted RecB family nuclease
MTRRTRNWVNKVDLARWLRCPYAFWLLDTGHISASETVTEFHRDLIKGGIRFQHEIEAPLPVMDVPPRTTWKRLIREHPNVRLHQLPILENPALKIYGRPDAVEIADGALIPVEIKAHKDVQRVDVLELAFYWRLLELCRTRGVEPEGRLILRRNGQPVEERVFIPKFRLAEVDGHLARIREARQHGIKPRICGCTVCSGISRHAIRDAVFRAKDVSVIYGVGRVYGPFLEDRCSIATWDQLLECNVEEVSEAFRAAGYGNVTTAEVSRWRLHAIAYTTARPAFANGLVDPFPIDNEYIALDLEYDEIGFTWLIGAYLVKRNRRTYVSYWTSNKGEESANIRALVRFVGKHSDLPVVTWSGKSADVPTLVKTAARHGINVGALLSRHVDLFDWARLNLRLPIPTTGLTEVAAYFGIPRVTALRDGFEAVSLYRKWVATQDEMLRERLLDYNRDDLEGLVGVVEGVRNLVAGIQAIEPGSLSSRADSA